MKFKKWIIGGVVGLVVYLIIIMPSLIERFSHPQAYDLIHFIKTSVIELIIVILVFSFIGYLYNPKKILLNSILIGAGVGFIIPTFVETYKLYFLIQPIKSILLIFYKEIGLEHLIQMWVTSILFYAIIGLIIGLFYNVLKKNKLINFSFLLILMLFILSYNVVAQEDQNLNITINSPSVVRLGTETLSRITIRNLYETNVMLEKISFLDNNENVILNEEASIEIESIKSELLEYELLIKEYQNKDCDPLIVEKIENISRSITEKTFAKTYYFDLKDFKLDLKPMDDIPIKIKLEFIIDNQTKIEIKLISVLYSQPLPNSIESQDKVSNSKMSVMSALPSKPIGWYAGDQHVHSSYGYHWLDPTDPLSDMVLAEKSANMDWVIFTDHSHIINNVDWTNGYNDCLSKNSYNFKCLYGQEMQVDYPNAWCDQYPIGGRHFLAYPYNNDYLGYIDGNCGSELLLYCICRPTQTVLNEINSVGGMSFRAHPYNLLDYPEPWDITGFTGIEIWNSNDGSWGSEDANAFNKWQEFLQYETDPTNGFVVGIGNSDAHKTPDIGNQSFTYCYMDSLSTSNIRDSLKKGHCVISNGPLVYLTINNKKIGEQANIYVGDNLIHIEAYSNSEFGELDNIKIYVDGNYKTSIPLSGYSYSNDIILNLQTSNKYIYLKLETTDGKHLAYTNPIWVNVQQSSCDHPIDGSNLSTNTNLCKDETYSLTNGLNIMSSNVELNCNGATLMGPGYFHGQSGITINNPYQNKITFTNIKIKNCNINGYSIGIWASRSNNITLFNNNISNSMVGNFIDAVDNVEMKNSRFENNTWYGVQFDSSNSSVINNQFVNNSKFGLWVESGNNNKIYNNIFKITGVKDDGQNNTYCINGTGNYYFNNATGPTCNITPVNIAPNIHSFNVYPLNPTKIQSINRSVRCDDNDDTNLEVNISTYKNNIIQFSTNVSTTNGTVVSNLFTNPHLKGEKWNFTFSCFDGINWSSTNNTNITIANSPVNISDLSDNTTVEDATWQGNLINLSIYTNDSDGLNDIKNYTILNGNISLIICSINNNFVNCSKPAANQSGTSDIEITSNDGSSLSKDNFTITVAPVNDPPIMKLIPDITINENELATINVDAYDIDSPNLIYSINDSRFTQNNNIFTWQTNNNTGVYNVLISVSDGQLTTQQKVKITVVDIMPHCVIPTNNMTIYSNTVFCQGTYDLQNGIIIGTNNIILDCNNSKLKGNMNDTQIPIVELWRHSGILLTYKNNITIKNCNLENYVVGVYLYSSNYSIIENNTGHSNRDGIHLGYYSSNNIIRSNHLDNNLWRGIIIESSSSNNIENNSIYNQYDESYIYFKNKGQGRGIELAGVLGLLDIGGNNIIKNNLFVNNYWALFIWGKGNNLVSENNFENNEVGVLFYSHPQHPNSSNNKVFNNYFTKGGIDGWYDYQLYNSFCVDGIGNKYFNGATGPICMDYGIINIINPKDKSNYSTRSLNLDIKLNEKVKTLEASYDNKKFSKLCNNCTEYHRRISLNDSQHNIKIKAIRNDGSEYYNISQFLIDSKDPVIHKTYPKSRSYINKSSFIVNYTEDNLKEISLYINGVEKLTKTDCPKGKKQGCEFKPDIISYNNQKIFYYFVVEDAAGNTDSIKPIEVNVDMTNPQITKAVYNTQQKMFDVIVSEKVTLQYSDNGRRFSTLCTNCNIYNKYKSFSKGSHNIIIKSIDKAGNFDQEAIPTFIVV